MKVHFDFQDYFKDEKVKRVKFFKVSGEDISLRQKLVVTAEGEMKSIK
jgi:hypothetical protein